SIAARSLGASSPGSTSSARSEPSRRKRYAFSATGPTVYMRTSIEPTLSARAGRTPLAPVVERAVGHVAERDVDQQHEGGKHQGIGRLLLEEHDHEDREHPGRDARPLGGAL